MTPVPSSSAPVQPSPEPAHHIRVGNLRIENLRIEG